MRSNAEMLEDIVCQPQHIVQTTTSNLVCVQLKLVTSSAASQLPIRYTKTFKILGHMTLIHSRRKLAGHQVEHAKKILPVPEIN